MPGRIVVNETDEKQVIILDAESDGIKGEYNTGSDDGTPLLDGSSCFKKIKIKNSSSYTISVLNRLIIRDDKKIAQKWTTAITSGKEVEIDYLFPIASGSSTYYIYYICSSAYVKCVGSTGTQTVGYVLGNASGNLNYYYQLKVNVDDDHPGDYIEIGDN